MIRLGVAGYGSRIHGMISGPFRVQAPDLRVVAVIDPDRNGVLQRLAAEDREEVVFYRDLDAMVRDGKLDALAIGTRCNLHSTYAVRAARYDLPLFLEKPVAISLRQAGTLERAFTHSKCQVVVSFPLRVSPLCELAHQYISEQSIGTPVHIAALNYVPYGTVYWQEKYRDYEITGGLFLQKATHDLDYMMYLMGEPIVRVAAMGTYGQVFGGNREAGLVCSRCDDQESCLESPQNRFRNNSGGNTDHPCLFSIDSGSAKKGTLNEDCSSAVVEFASGAHGVYTQVFFTRRDGQRRGATISGYMGTLDFNWTTNELRHVRHHAPFSATERADSGASHFGGDVELARDFIAVIRGRGSSRTPIQTGIQSVYTCLAARQSARKKRFVEVRQVGSH